MSFIGSVLKDANFGLLSELEVILVPPATASKLRLAVGSIEGLVSSKLFPNRKSGQTNDFFYVQQFA